jgi:DsbC/DsbD-like thiol-disulfide interchange protein
VIRRAALAWAAALWVPSALGAQSPEVQVAAVPEFAAIAPGSPFRVALVLRIPAGWHIGWTNPGQSGLPTAVTWRAPRGIGVGEIAWPYPERDETQGIVSHVYRGAVAVVTMFRADSTARGAREAAELEAELSWGLCASVCVPQHRAVTVTVPIRAGRPAPSPAWAAVEAAASALPMRLAGLALEATERGDSVRLAVTGLREGPAPGSAVTFFPAELRRVAAVVPVRAIRGGVVVTLPGHVVSGLPAGRLAGVLVAERPWGGGAGESRGLTIDVPVARR